MLYYIKQNLNSPLNSNAAQNFKNNKSKFLEEVKKQIKEYANINDYENLTKQGIKLIENCSCCRNNKESCSIY